MDIAYLVQLLNNKLVALNNAKIQAEANGDVALVLSIEEEVLSIQNTLSQLGLLTTINATATSANMTHADVVASGVTAVQNQVQGPSAGAIIRGYDVSAYATDALYEEKIQRILAAMPDFQDVVALDVYIQDRAPGSPVMGDMIYAAVDQFSVDQALLVAIMQNDSQFGTKGIGATTFNPGNIGNTGSATRSFGSWAEGVTAVAEWLSHHRAL